MQQIDKLILKIQRHEQEGFWLILIALIGCSIGYSINLTRSLVESLVILTLMIGYIVLCLRLLYPYIEK
jgi:hypothetical protein